MVLTWDVKIPALTQEETRKAYLYLPASYEADPEKHYPVLYMFDGHNVFFDNHATYGKCWGMKEYMDETETELIIAAVECNHSPDHGRLKEYSPYSFEDPAFGKITGKGKLYMNWLVHTFKQDIDRNFRTLPDRDHTFIAGSSMGGLMSLYAVFQYNQVFSRAAALSPSLWVADGKLLSLAEKAFLRSNTVIYMDYGSKELEQHVHMDSYLSRMSSILIERHIPVSCRIIPGGSHCEASWERQLPFFMNTLLYNIEGKDE